MGTQGVGGRVNRGGGGQTITVMQRVGNDIVPVQVQVNNDVSGFGGGGGDDSLDPRAMAFGAARNVARDASRFLDPLGLFGGGGGGGGVDPLDNGGNLLDPLNLFGASNDNAQQGFDPINSNRSVQGFRAPTQADMELDAMGENMGGFFEDKIFALMIKIVEDFQKKIEERLKKLQDDAKKAEADKKGGGKDDSSESRNIEFEKVKFDMQKLSQMQQALSNVLNTMDELAKSAIRHIKV